MPSFIPNLIKKKLKETRLLSTSQNTASMPTSVAVVCCRKLSQIAAYLPLMQPRHHLTYVSPVTVIASSVFLSVTDHFQLSPCSLHKVN